MPNITITYVERKLDDSKNEVFTPLGVESLDGVVEVLLPQHIDDQKIYFTKKFFGHDRYQWLVAAVEKAPPSQTTCATFQVVLEAPPTSPPIEYLSQTLKKGKGRTIQSTIHTGTLVEIDYGHQLAIGRSDGELRSNKRYSDTIQGGEMHKRRLAIAVSVFRQTALQVVPITSQEPATGDKTAFEISAETLRRLKFYGNSGKRSWAIASMIETVSVRRALPPVSYYNHRGLTTSGRDTNYGISLSSTEKRSMQDALLHSIGVRDYNHIKTSLQTANTALKGLQPLPGQLQQLQAQSLLDKQEIDHLRLCKEVADMWASTIGIELQTEVDMLKAMYAQTEPPDTPTA